MSFHILLMCFKVLKDNTYSCRHHSRLNIPIPIIPIMSIFELYEVARLTLSPSRSSNTFTLTLDLVYCSSTFNLYALNSAVCLSSSKCTSVSSSAILSFSFNVLSLFDWPWAWWWQTWMSTWPFWWHTFRHTWPFWLCFHGSIPFPLYLKHLLPHHFNIPGRVQQIIYCVWFPNKPAIQSASLLFQLGWLEFQPTCSLLLLPFPNLFPHRPVHFLIPVEVTFWLCPHETWSALTKCLII